MRIATRIARQVRGMSGITTKGAVSEGSVSGVSEATSESLEAVSEGVSDGSTTEHTSELSSDTDTSNDGLVKFKHPSLRSFAGSTPFPMNPLFRPPPPLSSATRSAVALAVSNGESPRSVALRFRISLARTHAILRMRSLANASTVLQTNLAKGMESMLGSRTSANEQLRITTSNAIAPYLQLLDDDVSITPEEAASLLQRMPYAQAPRKIDKNPATPSSTTTMPTIKLPRTCSNADFVITDTSSLTPKVLVHEKSGMLRPATTQELWERAHVKPRRFTM